MTDLAPRTTLGDIVTSQPAAARVLERFGLDYCCGGTATLGAACAERGVDRAEVEAALADLGDPAPADWAHMSAVEMVDHLEATHHAYLCVELERLHRLADKVEAVHGERHPELAEIRSTFAQLRADLEPHLLKEERVLFPMIRELATATDSLQADHAAQVEKLVDRYDELDADLSEMSRLYADSPPTSYEDIIEVAYELNATRNAIIAWAEGLPR